MEYRYKYTTLLRFLRQQEDIFSFFKIVQVIPQMKNDLCFISEYINCTRQILYKKPSHATVPLKGFPPATIESISSAISIDKTLFTIWVTSKIRIMSWSLKSCYKILVI